MTKKTYIFFSVYTILVLLLYALTLFGCSTVSIPDYKLKIEAVTCEKDSITPGQHLSIILNSRYIKIESDSVLVKLYLLSPSEYPVFSLATQCTGIDSFKINLSDFFK